MNLRNRNRLLWAAAACAAAVSLPLTGCGTQRGSVQTVVSETPAAQQESTAVQTNAVTEARSEAATEAQSEPETKQVITSVEYTSTDGTVRIILPDNNWKVTQDADEMRVFSSGDEAMINIVHASTEASMKTLSLQTSRADLEAALTEQYSSSTAYDVESFDTVTKGNVSLYRYVVKYNAAARMWAYSVTYGLMTADQAYVVNGTVPDDNKTLLKAVEDSVNSFVVLTDKDLSGVSSKDFDTASSTEKTAQSETSSAASSQEQTTLSAYGSAVTMYSNDDVNVRSGPGTDSDVIDALVSGDKVTVTGETSGWYQVSINGATGYVRKDFLTSDLSTVKSAQSETTAETSASGGAAAAELAAKTDYSTASTLYATDGVRVRSQPGTDSEILGSLGAGNAVTVIGETANWYIVSTGSGVGYVSKSYLSSTAPASSGTSSSGTGTSGTSSSGTGTSSSGTGTSSGSGTSGTSSSGSTSTITGTVVGSSATSITVEGNDGNTYTIYTGDATISAADGLYNGASVTATVDNSQTAWDGTRYATSVSGG